MAAVAVGREFDDTAPHAQNDFPTFFRKGRGFETTLHGPVPEAMSHHLESTCTHGIHDLSTFLKVSDLELLLEEDGCLLVGGLDDSLDEDMVWR